MTLYFQGTELEAVTPNFAVGTYGEVSSVGYYDSGYSRAASVIGSLNVGEMYVGAADPLTDFYMWWYWKLRTSGNNIGATYDLVYWYDDSDLPVVRCYWSATSVMVIQTWNGSAWVTAGAATMAVSGLTVDKFSIHIDVLGSKVQFWKANVLVVDETVDLSAVTNGIRYARVTAYVQGSAISEVMIADEPLITWRCKTLPPNADGSDTDGVGSYADVDEIAMSDTDGVVLDTGQRQSFTHDTVALTGYIRAFTAAGRFSRTDEASPSQVKAYVVRGVTRYYSDPIDLNVGLTNVQHTWNDDPSTATLWDLSVINAGLEWGWEVV